MGRNRILPPRQQSLRRSTFEPRGVAAAAAAAAAAAVALAAPAAPASAAAAATEATAAIPSNGATSSSHNLIARAVGRLQHVRSVVTHAAAGYQCTLSARQQATVDNGKWAGLAITTLQCSGHSTALADVAKDGLDSGDSSTIDASTAYLSMLLAWQNAHPASEHKQYGSTHVAVGIIEQDSQV
eukprot:TRINITY_DN7404_c4_g1_i1.p1 TRINITY_DN7404_c4_g1~~TRINITY_DN7404_c4_g1_i1.p1  ORF type:complete len:184 (-),score=50.82 TRINITY_DN7404_c4_g1_i1:121-672(-)